MTKAGETDHDKELQKAFAEFKQSLRHDPPGPDEDNAPKLAAPEIVVAEPRRPSAQPPKLDTRPVLGASLSEAVSDIPPPAGAPGTPDKGRRRGLLYLSAAIVVSGLAAVGWTLSHGARPEASSGEAATAAVSPENPAPNTAATTEAEAPPAKVEAPPAKVEAPPSSAQAPVDAPPQTAASPAQDPAAPTPATLSAAPANPSPNQGNAAPALSGASDTATSPAFPAAVASPPVKTEAAGANARQTSAPAKPDARAVAKPKTASKPIVAKAKPKQPAPARNASRPASTPTSGGSAVAPSPAPVAETAPAPAPPPSNDGALGFVKRTVNSVGSTITNLGRNAIGN